MTGELYEKSKKTLLRVSYQPDNPHSPDASQMIEMTVPRELKTKICELVERGEINGVKEDR